MTNKIDKNEVQALLDTIDESKFQQIAHEKINGSDDFKQCSIDTAVFIVNIFRSYIKLIQELEALQDKYKVQSMELEALRSMMK